MTLPIRLKASLLHLAVSACVAGLVGTAILWRWFPGDYVWMAHGWQLLLIILGVDAVCGPLLTAVLFNPAKSRRELTLDMSLVVLVQLMALTYGIHTAIQARPVVTVFERDRFRVISAAEIDPDRLVDALPELQALPFDGPRVIGVRTPVPTDPDYGQAVDLALAGLDVSFRPKYWRPYDSQRDAAVRVSRPVSALKARHAGEAARIDAAVARSGVPADRVRYLPTQTRHDEDWVALIDAQGGRILAFLPLDGF